MSTEKLDTEQPCTIDSVMLPCPFCGGTDIEYELSGFHETVYQDTSEGACVCQNCGAKGASVVILHKYENGVDITPSSEKEAISLWNNRYEA